MFHRKLSVLLLTMVLATGALAQTQTAPAALPKSQPVEIPFELVSKHIFLKIKVGDSKPLNFIFDTGDQVAIINLPRAQELGLKLEGELKVGGAGPNTLSGSYVKETSFSIPGLDGFSQPVRIALPLGAMAPQLGQDFDGIVGAEFIRQFVVEIDYQKSVIRLHNKDTFQYSGNGDSIPVTLNRGGHPIIDGEVTPEDQPAVKGKFVLDLGSGGALSLSSPFVAEHHLPGPNTKTIPLLGGGGAGGAISGKVGRVTSLKLGKFTLNKPVALFSEDKGGALAGNELIGNIGYYIASRFKIFLDYSHQRMILEPTANFADSFDRFSAGLRIVAEGQDYKTFRVKNLLDDSPATDAGVQKEDIITAIDGVPASRLTLSKISEQFEKGGRYKLTVMRGDHPLELTLTPRKII